MTASYGTPIGFADASATTSRVVTLPSNSAGDTLIVAIGCRPATINTPSGWLIITGPTGGSQSNAVAFYKKSTGSEASVTITTDSIACAGAAFTLTGAADPDTSPPEGASLAYDTNDNSPNSPNLAPSGGSADYLWMTWFFQRDDGAMSAYPASYGNTGYTSNGTTYVKTGWANRALTATSEDPGAFTTDDSHDWSAVTIAVYPAGAGGGSNLMLFRRHW